MTQIIIKKNDISDHQVSEESKLDLRNNQSNKEQKHSSKKWLYTSLFLFLIIVCLGVNYWFLILQENPFNDLIPENAVAYSIINQIELYPQISPFNQVLQEKNLLSQDIISKINNCFNQAGLDFFKDIQSLFKNQFAFVLLPTNSEISLPFLVILERNKDLAKTSQILNSIELEFNKEFNLYTEDYRQIKIAEISPLSNSNNNYFYTQIEKYFIVSNSQESLEKIVDSIINF